jgi:hypothetical protein
MLLAMGRKSDPAWAWMAGAFGGGLALAAAILGAKGTGFPALSLALRMTARWSFLFFWLAYTGGAMARLFGPAFGGLARRKRELGLSFAAAHLVHAGLIIWLGIASAQVPLQGWVRWFFLAALFVTYLLAMLSFGAGPRLAGRAWRPLLFLGTSFILLAFGRDFVLGALDSDVADWRYALAYVPFAMLTLAAVLLRVGAFLQRTRLRTA